MIGACMHPPSTDCVRCCRPVAEAMRPPPGVVSLSTSVEVDAFCGAGSLMGDLVERELFPSPPKPPRVPGRISCTPGVCGGKPCLDGTRIPVDTLWSFIEVGHSDAEILRECPTLVAEDVKVSRALFKMARRHWKRKTKAAMREAFAVVAYGSEEHD